MRTKKLIKIITISTIFVISLFSCLFSNVLGHSKSNLENNSSLGALEEEALKKSDQYFNFDAEKLVKSSTPKPVSYLSGGYHWGERGNICISPSVHTEATQQQITCILDVSEDGTVKVYTKGKTKTTTYKQNPQAVLRAYELAYYASKSLDANETGIPQSSLTGGTLSYKVLMRFYCFAYHFNKFAELGVPSTFNPQASGGYTSLQKYQDQTIKQIKKDIKNGGPKYTGRFIFLSGILPTNSNSGQNDMMFSAKESKSVKLEIVKQDQNDTNKKLKGAKFNIYKITKTQKGKTKETLVKEGATTNKNGVFTLTNGIKVGEKYKIVETKAPDGYQLPEDNSRTITIKAGTNTINIKDEPFYQILIRKISTEKSSTGKKVGVNGAEFRIQVDDASAGEDKGKYLYKKNDGTYGYTDVTKEATSEKDKAIYQASVFTTKTMEINGKNKKGYIKIEKLEKAYKFKAYEIKAPNNYQEPKNSVTTIAKAQVKKAAVVEIENKPYYDMSLKKVDEETGESVEGAVFRFKNSNTNSENYDKWLYAKATEEGKIEYGYTTDTSGENYEASLFRTNKEGIITLEKLKNKNTFIAYEIQAAPGYILNEDLNKNGVPVSTQDDKVVTVTNKKATYVQSIEGIVFLDKVSGKTSKTNDLYDKNEDRDEGVNGVRVMLKRNGQIVAEVASGKDSRGETLENGHYKFYGEDLKISKEDLKEYEVEFEYNGIKYQSIENVYTEQAYNSIVGEQTGENGEKISEEDAKASYRQRSSKSKEAEKDRTDFNQSFSTIESRERIDKDGKSTNLATNYGSDGVVSYEHYDDEETKLIGSKIIFEASQEAKTKGYSDDYYANDLYHITSSTKCVDDIKDLSQTGEPGGYPYDSNTNSIQYINLGLNLRMLPDVSVRSTLSAAEVSLNGYSNIYEYNRRQQYLDDANFTVWLKKTDVDYNRALTRELYKSDLLYSKEQKAKGEEEKAANVYLTYKIKLNNGSSLTMNIDELIDYYDQNLEIVSAGTETETIDKLDIGSSKQRLQVKGDIFNIDEQKDYEDQGYNNRIIKTQNITLGDGESKEIYIQFKIKLDSLINLLEQDEGIDIENIIEVNKVTATENGEPVPALDIDSAVGNAIPNEKLRTLEDDTDWSEAINVKMSEEARQIEGIVFEDKTEEELRTGEERKGNGIYEAEETGIDNVKVSLVDIDTGKVATKYENDGEYPDLKQTSSDGGKYTLRAFIPGNYIVVYTYGADEKYTAQQYKSTIYGPQDKNQERVSYYIGDNKDWYKTEKTNGTPRYSDAIDNYIHVEGENEYPEGIPSYSDMRTFYKIAAGTPYENTKTRYEIEQIWDENDNLQHHTYGTEVDNTVEIDAYTAHMGIGVEEPVFAQNSSEETENGKVGKIHITDIDFGIVERPRYKVGISEEINRIIVNKNDDSVLKDIQPSKAEKQSNVIYVANGDNNRGIVDMSIDTELLQGSKISVEYSYKVKNESETEYNTYNYYQLGIVPEDDEKDSSIVKISVENMTNFVDNELKFDTQSKMITDGNTSTNEANKWKKLDWENEADKYIKEKGILSGENGTCKYNTILLGQKFSNTNGVLLAPTQETEPTQLLLQTNLSATQEKMRYNNCAEVVEVTKDWGREIYKEQTEELGNFDVIDMKDDFEASVAAKEPDTSYAEEIIIHPPTGKAQNNTLLYVTIGMCILAVITAGGIIFTKKKNK